MFGRIRPDKGYDIALRALQCMPASSEPVILLIAGGAARKDKQDYLKNLKEYVAKEGLEHVVQFYDYHIPDSDVEIFFKAADVLLLPYKEGDFQSGVVFLAYRFGLPIIASDVGSFADEIAPGIGGYIFDSQNPQALAASIAQFYQDMQWRGDVRQHMQQYGDRYSWGNTVQATIAVYRRLLQGCR
jgi:glycosyltransferase involved in cell wall biosynthesis